MPVATDARCEVHLAQVIRNLLHGRQLLVSLYALTASSCRAVAALNCDFRRFDSIQGQADRRAGAVGAIVGFEQIVAGRWPGNRRTHSG